MRTKSIITEAKMATALSNTTTSSNLYNHPISSPSFRFSPPYQLHRLTIFPRTPRRDVRRLAVDSGPPSPPGPDPPPPRNTTQLAGFVGTVTRIQDRVKIFLAVLFWMSLFFWVTVTDGRGKGKGKKGSRFK